MKEKIYNEDLCFRSFWRKCYLGRQDLIKSLFSDLIKHKVIKIISKKWLKNQFVLLEYHCSSTRNKNCCAIAASKNGFGYESQTIEYIVVKNLYKNKEFFMTVDELAEGESFMYYD